VPSPRHPPAAGKSVNPGRLAQSSPAVWTARSLSADHRWIVELDERARAAISRAARQAVERGETISSLSRDRFDLESLTGEISHWTEILSRGSGLLLLKGFPVDELDEDELELAFMGLGCQLGIPVGQNASGDLLTHIRDERLPAGTSKVRLYRTAERQDFHTDGADLIGLLCLHGAASGGESLVVSAGALYNELLDRRPDLLEVLYQPMSWDRQGEEGPGEQPWFDLAPICDLNGRPRIFYLGWYIRDAQQHASAPRLSDEQLEAMALLEEIANDPHFHVEMTFEPGDIQLINNGLVLHAREAYVDVPELSKRRHLLRLWLAAHEFSSVDDVLRAGMPTTR